MKKNPDKFSLAQELIEAATEALAHARGEIELPTHSFISRHPHLVQEVLKDTAAC